MTIFLSLVLVSPRVNFDEVFSHSLNQLFLDLHSPVNECAVLSQALAAKSWIRFRVDDCSDDVLGDVVDSENTPPTR